jgi:hypothetical protein
MCFLITKENYKMEQAAEDTVVWKNFSNNNVVFRSFFWKITPFRNHKWSLSGEESVYGFYSYFDGPFIAVEDGLHAYIKKEYAQVTDSMSIYKMVIPKGAYYINNGYEIVATQMKFAYPPNIVYLLGSLWFKFKKLW